MGVEVECWLIGGDCGCSACYVRNQNIDNVLEIGMMGVMGVMAAIVISEEIRWM